MNIAVFLDEVTRWAASRSDIVGLALVGSHARGTARPDSDVDLVLLSSHPEKFLDGAWTSRFGEIKSFAIEDYGALKSLRVIYEGGLEVEFGLADRNWASTPLEPGTRNVLVNGCHVLYDPEHLFRVATAAA